MTQHYYEKIIVEAKEIYTDYLIMVLTSPIYEGIKSTYNDARETELKYIEGSQKDPNIKNPGVLKIFQYFLYEVRKMSDAMIETEVKRIKSACQCADIFDDLVKAVVKSNIIVLTYNSSGKKCKIVNEKMHEKVEVKNFIHKCYLECAQMFFDNPTLFWHEYTNHQLKENQRMINQMIKMAIKNAIKKILPIKEILTEYLKNDYEEEPEQDQYTKIKDMLMRDIHNKHDDRKLFITSENDPEQVGENGNVESLILGGNDMDLPDQVEPVEPVKQAEPQVIDLDQEKKLVKESDLFKKARKSKNTDKFIKEILDDKNKQELAKPKQDETKSNREEIEADIKKKDNKDDDVEISINKKSTYYDEHESQK